MGSSWVAFFCRKSFLNKSKKGNSGAVQTGCAFVVMQTEDHKYDYDLLQPAEGGEKHREAWLPDGLSS
jgi:hypothetical protein